MARVDRCTLTGARIISCGSRRSSCSTSPGWSPTSTSPIRRTTFRRSPNTSRCLLASSPRLPLAVVVPLRRRVPAVWRDVGHLIGWLAVIVGLAGVILHLDSQFFHARTLRSLTYAAPFAAPLAYTGLGLLLIVNRMVDPRAAEWAQWVLLLALGGFVGNFVFSLTDHAMNGFFNPVEWVPVVSSACAIAFLLCRS